jgi:hypothetical protein
MIKNTLLRYIVFRAHPIFLSRQYCHLEFIKKVADPRGSYLAPEIASSMK